ncbi:MAG: FkbM family methyltransferase [Caulobacterales bacterium]|jgi:FkbM family methyltransferase
MQDLNLSLKQRFDWFAHSFKAITQDHHRELMPLLRQYIPAAGVVLDVGAHAGQFARMFAQIAGDGHVFSFEPSPYARSVLEAAVKWRAVGNITVVAKGLGDAPGVLELATPIKRRGSLGFGLAHVPADGESAAGQRRDRIEIETIDGFVAARGLKRLDFIKVDVEGFEGRVMAGAQETLRRFKPAVLLELHPVHLGRGGDTSGGVAGALEALGYRAQRVTAAGGLEPVGQIEEPGDFLFSQG